MGIFNLTESEKKEILNLHNNAKLLKEQSTPPLDDKAKIMKIQTLLNTKYKAGLKVDGILGQNTLTALSNAMKATQASADKFKETFSQMSKNAENLPKTIFGTNTDTGTQVAAPASGTTAAAATTQAAPAATTQAAPAATTQAAPAATTQAAPAATTQPAPAATTQPALSQTSQQALSGQLTPQQIRQQGRFDQRLARQARRNQRRAQQ
jgi:hypothetical protein